ncbi:hypothetical protein, partial [Bacteroides ndongoniae]|uniref:hypothetical protein n=1 Tax=Bacteroides ndongoniae TaxID=1903262 RepID=UPI0023F8CA08
NQNCIRQSVYSNRSVSQEMSTIIVYKIKKRLVKSGKDNSIKKHVFSTVKEKFFSNWRIFFS